MAAPIFQRYAEFLSNLAFSPFHSSLLPPSILASSPFQSCPIGLASKGKGGARATDPSRRRWQAKGRAAHGGCMDLHQELQPRRLTWPPHRQQHLLRQAIHRRQHLLRRRTLHLRQLLLCCQDASCKVLRHILPGGRNPVPGFIGVPHLQIHAPPQPTGENFHFVGGTNNMTPPSPATTPTTRNPNASINTDDDDDTVEPSKPVRRRFWSHDEEVKLASAWLNTSKDPIHGNDMKIDSFWGQITKECNRNTPQDRRRDTNQLKCHWKRLSGLINEFNGFWTSVCKLNKSGYSDDQLMNEAQQMYQKKHSKPV